MFSRHHVHKATLLIALGALIVAGHLPHAAAANGRQLHAQMIKNLQQGEYGRAAKAAARWVTRSNNDPGPVTVTAPNGNKLTVKFQPAELLEAKLLWPKQHGGQGATTYRMYHGALLPRGYLPDRFYGSEVADSGNMAMSLLRHYPRRRYPNGKVTAVAVKSTPAVVTVDTTGKSGSTYRRSYTLDSYAGAALKQAGPATKQP